MSANPLALPGPGLHLHVPTATVAGAALTAILALPAFSEALPIPTSCQVDPAGANDLPGQRDLTMFCVERGGADSWDMLSLIQLDEVDVFGANTIDSCMLFNIDGDAFADLAACVTLRSSGSANDNRTQLQELRLYTCDDSKADRCMGAVPIPGPYTSTCELSHPDADPFSPAAENGPGDDYPYDSRVICGLDFADFGLPSEPALLLDGCTFPSQIPNSASIDCILFAGCTSDGNCNDLNACTADSCDPTGVCRYTAGSATACTDGQFCNGAELCNALGFCESAGAPLSCDDGIACTIDDCDELAGACVHDPRPSLCGDDLWCNGVETCDPVAGCLAGSPPDCGDGIGCTTDACDEAADSCDHLASDAACDDGAWCNGAEVCEAGIGCAAGIGPDCDDQVACTVDACVEETRSCGHSPNDGSCDDGLFCNGAELCDQAAGCVAAPRVDCDDGVACTADECSEAADVCLHEPNHASCGDGVWCNGVEICTPAGCDAGVAPCDAPAVCVETTVRCVGCTNDVDCDDGLFCNGQEVCHAGTGLCGAGVAADCDDGVACTIDACDESADACVSAPGDALCSDGLFCNGEERCEAATGCTAGDPPCDDGVACTVDSCLEATRRCSSEPDHARCDDGRYCNGEEICITGYGCEEGEPVACRPDRFHCSVESCNDSIDGCESDFSRCVCGDGELVAGEECERPAVAGTFEDCNNLLDDDGDGTADCADPDCAHGSARGTICGENCEIDRLCARIGKDPAMIRFEHGRRPDSLWIHGHFPVDSEPDPRIAGFEVEISNGERPVYFASLEPGDLEGNASDATRFKFRDRDARQLGQASARGGLETVSLEYRSHDGRRVLAFRLRAYGDFSAATHRRMSTQVAVGAEVGSLTAEWSARKQRWILRQSDF